MNKKAEDKNYPGGESGEIAGKGIWEEFVIKNLLSGLRCFKIGLLRYFQ